VAESCEARGEEKSEKEKCFALTRRVPSRQHVHSETEGDAVASHGWCFQQACFAVQGACAPDAGHEVCKLALASASTRFGGVVSVEVAVRRRG